MRSNRGATSTGAASVRRAEPLVLVVPDGSHRQLPDDIADGVDRVLGIER